MRRGRLFDRTTNSNEGENSEDRPFNTHIKNFDVYFDLELAPEIERLAKFRNELWSRAINNSIWMLAIVMVVMLIAMFFFRAGPAMLIILFIGVAIGAVIVSNNYISNKEIYNSSFKEEVIKKMMIGIDERLNYQPIQSVNLDEYYFSQLFKKRVDRHNGEDLIEATIDKTTLRFSELHTEHKTQTRNSKGRTQTHWSTIFKGVFFVIDFNKAFKYHTVVLPDYNQQMFGDLFKSFQFGERGNAKLVNMDHPVFEKLFKVYSDNAVEAHYLLTPNLMERIIKLQRKFKNDIYLSFGNSKLSVAISNDLNLFEAPRLWGNPDFLNLVKTYHDYLHNCLEIVNDLNLNIRIWGKE